MSEKNNLLIAQLKQVRIEKHYSYQYIADECEKLGYSVSMSTVRRVFAEGSEEQGFRYATLRPIARVVLDLDEAGHSKSASADEVNALHTMISIKEGQLADVERKLADAERKLAEKEADIVRLNRIIDRLLDK